MSGVSPASRINLQDIAGAPKYVELLARTINQLIDAQNQALAKGQTLAANLAGSIVEFEVRTTAGYSSGDAMAVRFKADLRGQRASGVLVFKVTDLDFPNAVLSGEYECSTWEQSGDEILVKWISGLEASHRYNIRFWVAV